MTLDLLAIAEGLLAPQFAGEQLLAEADLSGGEHGMVAFYPAPDLARRLAVDGGEKPEDLHVTLAFLGKDFLPVGDQRAAGLRMLQGAVMRWASRTGPMRGVIAGRGLFTEGPTPVTYLAPDIPALPAARERLVGLLAAAGYPARSDHGYTPHCTVAYKDLENYQSPRGIALEFDQVVLVVGDTRYPFPLTGSNPPTDSDRQLEAAWLEVFIESNLTDHAKGELERAGLMDKDSDYGGMLGKAVLKLMKTFSGEGHSGTSAMMAIELFKKLAAFEPLTPLTDHPDEWMDVAAPDPKDERYPNGMWQSRRHPGAFSPDGGKTYTLLDDRYANGRKRNRTYTAAATTKPSDAATKPSDGKPRYLTRAEAIAASRSARASEADARYIANVRERFPLASIEPKRLAAATAAVADALTETLPAPLLRLYGYLAATKGLTTTREDVHDAWAVWKSGLDASHEDLQPFDEIARQEQLKDQPYVTAIHAAARSLA